MSAHLIVLALSAFLVVVPVGKKAPLQFPERVLETWVENNRVIDVDGNNLLYAQGLAPGSSWVILKGSEGTKRSYLVVVLNAK